MLWVIGYRLTESGYQPVVQAASADLGLNSKPCMQFRGQTQGNFAGIRLVRLTTYFCACGKVIINGFVKNLTEFLHGVRMKANYIIYSCNMPDKAFIFGAKAYNGCIALICHSVIHGFTPNFVRKVLASRIWYGAASFLGCGLWKYPMTSSRINLTREPSPSSISQPTANRSDSISAHTKDFGVGLAKIAASVFRCLLFMMYSGIKWWHCQETQ